MGPHRSAYHGTSRDRWRVVRWPSGLQDLYSSFLDWHSWTAATFISGCSRSRLEFFRHQHQQYLSVTSRSDDVLPPQWLWLSMLSGISKRALPSRSSALFAFLYSAEVFCAVLSSVCAGRFFKRKRKGRRRKEPFADRSSCRRCRSTATCAIPTTRPSQGCQPCLFFAAGILGRSCVSPAVRRSGRCLPEK